jgi:hypothetical protein
VADGQQRRDVLAVHGSSFHTTRIHGGPHRAI